MTVFPETGGRKYGTMYSTGNERSAVICSTKPIPSGRKAKEVRLQKYRQVRD